MSSLVEARWKRYADRVARGEITADNYVYQPRGPMPPHSKAKQDLTRWENQIANAQLVRFALEGRKLSARQVEQMAKGNLSRKRRRLHLRFDGRAAEAVAFGSLSTLFERTAKHIRAQRGIDVSDSSRARQEPPFA